MTRDVLDEMISQVVDNSRIECTGVDCQSLIEQVLANLMERKRMDVMLARTGEGWAVLDDQLEYVTMTSGKISGELSTLMDEIDEQANKNANSSSGSSKGSSSGSGTRKDSSDSISSESLREDSRKATAKIKVDGSVALEGPLAMVADVSVLSRDAFDYRMALSISQNIPVDRARNLVMVRFKYPALSYSEKRIPDATLSTYANKLREQCESGSLEKTKTNAKKGRKSALLWITETADKDHYIEKSNVTYSGRNARERRHISRQRYPVRKEMRFGENNDIHFEELYESVTHVFECSDSNNKYCEVVGKVTVHQQPKRYLPYLIKGLREMIPLQ